MKERILFKSKKIREEFFKKVIKSLKLQNWINLSDFLKIRRNVLFNYRKGKLTLPIKFYETLSQNFSELDKDFFSKNSTTLDNGWGRVKAGKATYSKHKFLFDEGRKKAILNNQRRGLKINMNIPLNQDLAYFIGLFVGDGFTNKYGGYYLTQFIGHVSEKEFYNTRIKRYCENSLGVFPVIKEYNQKNYIRMNIYSKGIFKLITERFKIPAGAKSRIVLIPSEILKSNINILKSFIRGLYDAEGFVFFDKRHSYKKPYPRIDLHMCNLKLLEQVFKTLQKIGIKCNLTNFKESYNIQIYGYEQVSKFIKEIGFYNPKQLNKLKQEEFVT